MMRIDISDIIFDLARRLSEAGCYIKPQWGPVFLLFSMGLTTVVMRLIMFKQSWLIERRRGR